VSESTLRQDVIAYFVRAGYPTRRPCVWGVELSSGRGFSHDAVRPNTTSIHFVLGFPGFHRHHGNSFGLGTFSSALGEWGEWDRREVSLL